jgi:hypothetical protein
VLADDPRWLPLRIRCAAAAMPGDELARWLTQLGTDDLRSADALLVCRAAVDGLPLDQLERFTEDLLQGPRPELRRIAVWALTRDAGPNRGWSPERLQRLATLQADPSPVVAGAALAVFPPREMAVNRSVVNRSVDGS